MAEIQGTCDERFGAVRDALAASLGKDDVGASVAVHVDGEPVVDLWGGHLDAARTAPWQRNTITNVWSTSKTMTALCALVLADRGELDLAAPVARYWPRFAAAGKENVQVRHVFAHTSGLPDWDGPTAVEDLYDGPALAARLAAQAPRWEPGTAAGYHSLTQGFVLGEVVRRITGRGLGAFFAEEIAGPLGADFHLSESRLGGAPPSRLPAPLPTCSTPEPVRRLALAEPSRENRLLVDPQETAPVHEAQPVRRHQRGERRRGGRRVVLRKVDGCHDHRSVVLVPVDHEPAAYRQGESAHDAPGIPVDGHRIALVRAERRSKLSDRQAHPAKRCARLDAHMELGEPRPGAVLGLDPADRGEVLLDRVRVPGADQFDVAPQVVLDHQRRQVSARPATGRQEIADA
jgi:hypothetical protein